MPLKITRDPAEPRPEAGDGQHWFIFATPRRDDHGTVILPEGGRYERYEKNPIVLWMHKSRPKPEIDPHTPEWHHVIGRAEEIRISPQLCEVLVGFDMEDEYARQIYGKVKRDFIRMSSMGFKPVRAEVMEPPDELTARRWHVPAGTKAPVALEWDLVEISIVTIGSNQDALAVRSLEEGVQIREAVLDDEDAEERAKGKKAPAPKKTRRSRAEDPGDEEDPDDQDPGDREPGDHGDGSDDEEEDRALGSVVKHEVFPVGDADDWDADAERHDWAVKCGGSLDDFEKVDKKKYSKLFAVVLGKGDKASDYKLPHHSVSSDGLVINRRGVSAALAALNGARGGVHAPEKLKKAALAHLEREKKVIEAHDAKKNERAAPADPPPLPSPLPTEERTMALKMSPDQRWNMRNLIGSHMTSAAGHLMAMSGTKDEGLLNFHKGCAETCMTRAMECGRFLRDSDGDGDEMRYAPLVKARTVPESAGTTELRAKFAEVAAEVQRFDVQTIEDAVRGSLKLERSIGDVEEVAAHFDAHEGMSERLTALASEQRKVKDDALASERRAEVNKLLEERLITPAKAKEALGEVEGKPAWSLTRLGKYRGEVEKGGQIAVVERVAPLTIVPQPGPGTVQPPAPPARQDDLLSVLSEQVRSAVSGDGSEQLLLIQAREIYKARMDFANEQKCTERIQAIRAQERAARQSAET